MKWVFGPLYKKFDFQKAHPMIMSFSGDPELSGLDRFSPPYPG